MKDTSYPGYYVAHLGAVDCMSKPFVPLEGQKSRWKTQDVTHKRYGFLRVICWYLGVVPAMSPEDWKAWFCMYDLLQTNGQAFITLVLFMFILTSRPL
jgi:hypothetical protein